jgi:hypothetical protein
MIQVLTIITFGSFIGVTIPILRSGITCLYIASGLPDVVLNMSNHRIDFIVTELVGIGWPGIRWLLELHSQIEDRYTTGYADENSNTELRDEVIFDATRDCGY